MYIYIYNIIISYIHVVDFVTTAFIQTRQNNYIYCVVTVDDELEYIPLLPYYICRSICITLRPTDAGV